jgi:hypothetical protein
LKRIFFIYVLISNVCFAQRVENDNEQLLTAGFQFRPVVASKFLGAGEITSTDRIFTATIKPKLGYTFGMVIRRGLTKKISIETGINYVRRNYLMTCVDDSLNMTDVSDFGMVTYEIPIQCLIYVRLGKQFYMNNSLGVSINWLASDVATLGENQAISQRSYVNRIIANPAVLANIGFEYRTKKAGFFYLGSSLHRPFVKIATTQVKYDLFSKKYSTLIDLTGAFLTIDFRYFFHSQPIKKKVHVEKKKKKT